MQEAEKLEEHFDIMTDTGKFRALLVESEKRVLDGVKKILEEEDSSLRKRLQNILKWIASQV